MPKRLAEGETYAGRRPDVVVRAFNIPRDAADLLQQFSGGKLTGHFIARLIYEHAARLEERQRLRERLHEQLQIVLETH